MRHGMVRPNINICRRPIRNRLWIPSMFRISRRSIPPQIPRRTSIAVQSVRLARHFFKMRLASFRVFDRNFHRQPILRFCQSRSPRLIWFIILHLWQHHRQLILWNRMRIAVFVVRNRDRTTPISLTRNQPIPHFISRFRRAKLPKITKFSLHNRQVELLRKFSVALVHCRHRHNCPCAIPRQHIIRHPNRDFFFRRRINRIRARKYARFFLIFLSLNL